MSAPASLVRSSIGKKVLMAVTGIILLLFLVGHMAGNLKAFLGAESFNHYAEFLRTVGEPVLPRTTLLWTIRLVLLASLLVHIVNAIAVWRMDRRSRRVGSKRYQSLAMSAASRSMLWGGVTIFGFVVYHLLHMTFGTLHPDFRHGEPYNNLVVGFQNPFVVAVYLLTMIPLGLHLYHGFWAAFQSLGSTDPRMNVPRRRLAAAISLVIVLGFAIVPLAIRLGFIQLGE